MLSKLSQGIAGIFTKAKLDDAALAQLEELMIEADTGVKTASALTIALSKHRFEKDVTPQAVKEFLAAEIADILAPLARPLLPDGKPAVILMVGTNGSGKTTTIGKLAAQYKQQGKKVMLAAADTFRAAAVEQLQEWGKRCEVPVITGPADSDPASVAYKAYEAARAANTDVLLIDSAGRLSNKAGLMAELQKICKTLKKIDPQAPHHVVQVLDAAIGQNTVTQVQEFKEMVQLTGLIVTKLDGTAKGGVLLALAKFGLPVHYVGMGEAAADLYPFEPIDFARNLLGLRS